MDYSTRRGRAKINLGVSLLFAVGVFVYLALAGAPVVGAVLGVIVVAAGLFEYRRTMQDVVTVERYEADAEANQRKRRQ